MSRPSTRTVIRAMLALAAGLLMTGSALLTPAPLSHSASASRTHQDHASTTGADDTEAPFYPTYDNVLARLQDLASAYPTIVSYQPIGVEAHGGRDIIAIKLSDNVGQEEDEPTWVFTGIIHGSEQIGMRILLDLAEGLAAGYGSAVTATEWIDAYEIWMVPILNAHGYDHSSDSDDRPRGTRKNGATSSSAATSGVDLARNYDFQWSDAPSGPTASPCSTTDPECSRFRGPSAFSESETQAIRDLFLAQRPLFGITFHQGNNADGGHIYRPWDGAAPDEATLSSWAALYGAWVDGSRQTGPFCDAAPLEDPNGEAGCTDALGAGIGGDHCANLCWTPTQSRLGAYGQPSNWYYHEVGTYDWTVEVSDRTFNEDFMHETTGPMTDREEDVKAIASEFARNHRDAIEAWFDYFLYTADPSQFRGPGLTGHISDAVQGIPLAASIQVAGHTSELIENRTSDSAHGRYWRFLPVGTHVLTVSTPGYVTWTGSVVVGPDALTEHNVALTPSLGIVLPDTTGIGSIRAGRQ